MYKRLMQNMFLKYNVKVKHLFTKLFFLAGIEKEFDQRLMPDGKVSVDGFICVFDVRKTFV